MDVTVTYHLELGTWWAESADMPGFTAVAEDYATTRAMVHEAVEELGDEVVVHEEFEVPSPARA